MKKLILAIACLLFLLGCTLQQNQIINYRIGYDGLSLDYVTFPEYNVYEKENFSVTLKAENMGAYDINNAEIVFGYPVSFISLNPSSKKPPFMISNVLHGSSQGFPQGEAVFFDTLFHAKDIFAAEEQKFDITATACYGYQTIAEMVACIGPRSGIGSCNFKALNRNLNLTQGQGAPLAVTEVEETIIETSPGKVMPRFRIVVENKGKGLVFRNPAQNIDKMCSALGVGDELNRFDFKLQLSKYSYDSASKSGSFSCPKTFKLENDKSELICSLNEQLEAGQTYNTMFRVTLDYGYSTSITKQVAVAKVLK